jgi:hypothetical protein
MSLTVLPTPEPIPEFGKQRTFTITIGGQERPAILDLNTLAQVMTLTGKAIPEIIANVGTAKLDDMISLTFACLNQANPALTRTEVTSWLNHRKMNNVIRNIVEHLQTWTIADGDSSLAPYVRTPDATRAAVIDELNLSTTDSLLDIGCGEGDILLDAIHATDLVTVYGIELNEDRAKLAESRLREKVQQLELTTEIKVECVDFQSYELPLVSHVYCYLLQAANNAIAEKLQRRYAGSLTKILSVDFTFPFPLESSRIVEGPQQTQTLYLYNMASCPTLPV